MRSLYKRESARSKTGNGNQLIQLSEFAIRRTAAKQQDRSPSA
jgi:hypothetical protein